jgi:hypothetical protein
MAMTLTIKQVPDQLVERLRRRAAGNRRSQQAELLLMLERTLDDDRPVYGVGEPAGPVYAIPGPSKPGARASRSPAAQPAPGKLSLAALWQRARKLGAPGAAESAAIIRGDRDARHRR